VSESFGVIGSWCTGVLVDSSGQVSLHQSTGKLPSLHCWCPAASLQQWCHC